MADFPASRPLPVVYGAYQNLTGWLYAGAITATLTSGANKAILQPIVFPAPYLVRSVWWANGTVVAGNTDVALMSLDGAVILSGGATAQAGTNIAQTVALGTPVLVSPGTYYSAISSSSGTAQYLGHQLAVPRVAALAGMAEIASGQSPLVSGGTIVTNTLNIDVIHGFSSGTVV